MRRLLGVLLTLALAASVLLTTTRFLDTGWRRLILAASFAPYAVAGFLGALLGCLLLLRRARRRRWLLLALAVCVAGLAAHTCWLVPLYVGEGGRRDLTVMSANLEYGRGEATTVVAAVASDDVGLLVLQEVTPPELAALDRAGLGELLAHRAGAPATDASGTMVFSRYRLDEVGAFELGNGGLALEVGAPTPFELLAVHTSQPVQTPGQWRVDMRSVLRQARRSVASGPTLVVGDFNATLDHAQLRRVLGTGLRDAAEQAGSGWQPTWPTRWRRGWLRPLIAIDHVLGTDRFTAVRTRTLDVAGSDHRALVTDLRTSQ